MVTSPNSNPLEAIRDPAVIRARLAVTVREADLLRRLLRIAESADASPKPTRKDRS